MSFICKVEAVWQGVIPLTPQLQAKGLAFVGNSETGLAQTGLAINQKNRFTNIVSHKVLLLKEPAKNHEKERGLGPNAWESNGHSAPRR